MLQPLEALSPDRSPQVDCAPVFVSALVCTRNRPAPIAKAVPLLLDSDGEFELLVIDQSDGPETEQALAPFRKDSRLAYHRSSTRGKGYALNEGLKLAKGSIVVCTDDDVEVPRGWATRMAKILASHPDAAIVFCNVLPVPHDRKAGYVPAYERKTDRLLTSITDVRRGVGLGAAMAIRRDFALSVGGFDESFGPGARFPSADEWDLSMRALLKGWSVYETPELAVVHDGFRSFSDGKQHATRDWVALGAVCAKPIRAGHLRALLVPAWFFTENALVPPLADVIRFRRPRGLSRIVAFWKGFAEGLGTRVDPTTLRYEKRA